MKRSKLVPLPKKGDSSNLKIWRGMNLLDVGSKISSVILSARAQKLLKSNVHSMQFGAVPGRNYTDAVFSLKSVM